MAGEQTRKPRPKREEAEASEAPATETRTKEIDGLLDKIDEILEENAEEFVRSYVQKGGQ